MPDDKADRAGPVDGAHLGIATVWLDSSGVADRGRSHPSVSMAALRRLTGFAAGLDAEIETHWYP